MRREFKEKAQKVTLLKSDKCMITQSFFTEMSA